MSPRVAVIGAGLAGSLLSLDLARRGIAVDLFDRQDEPVSEASFFNEGKIHLGFLYAHDPSRATSRLMIEGATSFRGIVQDLIGFDVSAILSTPFVYAVHRDSLLSSDDFEGHLHQCCSEFADLVASQGGGYVDGSSTVEARLLPRGEWEGDLDPAVFASVFQTSERSVDPRRLAIEVRKVLREARGIEWRPGTRVDSVASLEGESWRLLDGMGDTLGHSAYDVVVNATWSDLLRLDAQVGIEPPADWSYRYKLGNRIIMPIRPQDLRSVTVVLGAFGDIVNFGAEGGVFLSWYPHGRLLMTEEIDLADWNGREFEVQREQAYARSRDAWEGMSRALRALGPAAYPVDARGGMILATGRLDVDDALSPLHSRVQVGISRQGTYLSVNTGKFTLAPLMARKAANEVASLVG